MSATVPKCDEIELCAQIEMRQRTRLEEGVTEFENDSNAAEVMER